MDDRLKQFVALACDISWKTQGQLRVLEDELAHHYHITVLQDGDEERDDVLHYLNLTSLPFAHQRDMRKHGETYNDIKFTLECLWIPPTYHETLIWRPTLGTGTMYPKFMVIGDAPGVGDGEFQDEKFDRVLVYGVSSHILRKALIHLDIYYRCWMTNLVKLSTPSNTPTTREQQELHLHTLKDESQRLRPSYLVLLGNHVFTSFETLNSGITVPYIKIVHPSYAVRSNWSVETYSDHIYKRLKECGAL